MNDSRYWVLDFDQYEHKSDLLASVEKNEIECIVDEEAGGIIAYVLVNPGERRSDLIAASLNTARAVSLEASDGDVTISRGLLARLMAAIETPGDLNESEVNDLLLDAMVAYGRTQQ